jgi:hypothetical protein
VGAPASPRRNRGPRRQSAGRADPRVEHLVAKEALLADDPRVFFTTPHFDNYAAILVRLDRISARDLDEVIVEAWLARAPKSLAEEYAGEFL